MSSIDAVLPLTKKDYERFNRILYKSMQLFFKDLGTCWIVTPDKDFDELRSLIKDKNYHVIPESAIVPELKLPSSFNHPFSLGKKVKGWFIQQLIKIAIAETVKTEFYLTLDVDVVCVKPVYFDDLIQNGRAISQINSEDFHPEWYQWAEKPLGMHRSGLCHGVTPAILNKDAIISLQNYLSQKVNPAFKFVAKYTPYQSLWHNYLTSWRGYLLRNLPWTEYALYNTYLEATNQYNKYHFRREFPCLYSNGVWTNTDFQAWCPTKSFNTNTESSFFTVIQSISGVSPDEILEKIGVYLQ